VFGQLGFGAVDGGGWKFHKYVKEAAFGPDLPVNTVFIVGKLVAAEDKDFRGLLVFLVCLSLHWRPSPSLFIFR